MEQNKPQDTKEMFPKFKSQIIQRTFRVDREQYSPSLSLSKHTAWSLFLFAYLYLVIFLPVLTSLLGKIQRLLWIFQALHQSVFTVKILHPSDFPFSAVLCQSLYSLNKYQSHDFAFCSCVVTCLEGSPLVQTQTPFLGEF